MLYCQFLVLILLGVDWLEDPQFGQSAFSHVMASQPCYARREYQQQEFNAEQLGLLTQHEFSSPLPVRPIVAYVASFLMFPLCMPSLHFQMSLQH